MPQNSPKNAPKIDFVGGVVHSIKGAANFANFGVFIVYLNKKLSICKLYAKKRYYSKNELKSTFLLKNCIIQISVYMCYFYQFFKCL